MVSFTGGEPLFDQRLEDIISLFDTGCTLISITTNGILLSTKRAERFKSIGADSFVISLDGPDSKSNDEIRGKGTFERIMDAIQVAKSHRFFTMIIHTVSHRSIERRDFDKLIELAESLSIPLHLSLVSPTGNLADDDALKGFVLTKKDIEYFVGMSEEASVLEERPGWKLLWRRLSGRN